MEEERLCKAIYQEMGISMDVMELFLKKAYAVNHVLSTSSEQSACGEVLPKTAGLIQDFSMRSQDNKTKVTDSLMQDLPAFSQSFDASSDSTQGASSPHWERSDRSKNIQEMGDSQAMRTDRDLNSFQNVVEESMGVEDEEFQSSQTVTEVFVSSDYSEKGLSIQDKRLISDHQRGSIKISEPSLFEENIQNSQDFGFFIQGERSSKVGLLIHDVVSYDDVRIKEDVLYHNIKEQMQMYLPQLCCIHYQGQCSDMAHYRADLEQALKGYSIDYLMVLGQSFYTLVDKRVTKEELRGSVYRLTINERAFRLVYSYQISSLLGSARKKQAFWEDFMFFVKQTLSL